jgi:hypothetical protein
MSLRAYARRRGTSAPSVLRAIERGRLKASLVFVKGKAQIGDPDLADREWAANTDLTKAPGYVKERAAGGPRRTVTARTVTPGSASGNTSLADASAAEKLWKSRLAELEYRREAGELVEAADVSKRWADILVRVRTRLLAVPSKVKSARSELTLDQVAVIDQCIRQALEEIADEANAA